MFDDAHEEELQELERGEPQPNYDIYYLWAMCWVEPRNVHYYVQRGLIPKAIGSGPGARYTYEHVVRLQVLMILKKRDMSLDQIKVFLDGHTIRELHRYANGADPRGGIENVLSLIRCRDGSPAEESGEPTRIRVADGLELLIGNSIFARLAVRLDKVLATLRDIVGVDPPDPPEPPDPFDAPDPPEME